MLLSVEQRLGRTERLARSRCERGDFVGALNLALLFFNQTSTELNSLDVLEPLAATVRTCLQGLRPAEDAIGPLPIADSRLHYLIGMFGSHLRAAAYALTEAGRLQGAKSLASYGFDIAYLHLGCGDATLALYLSSLIDIHFELQEYAVALPLLHHKLELLPPTSRITGELRATVNQLGVACRHLGRYAEAERHYRQAIELCHSDDQLEIATILNNLGTLYVDMGRLSDAKSVYTQSLDIRRAALGDHDPRVIASLNNLAGVYRRQGDLPKAAVQLRAALENSRAKLGERHPDVALLLNNLGAIHLDMGDQETATALLLQALDIRRSVLGENHPDTAATLENLSRVTLDPRLAAQLTQQALDIQRAATSEQDPELARRMCRLAYVYMQQRDLASAATLLDQALALQRAVLDEHHVDFAQTFNNLGLLHHASGDYVTAERFYSQALELQREFHTPDARSVADVQTNLAAVCAAHGRVGEGMNYLEEALKTYSDNIGLLFAGASERQRAQYVAKFREDYDSWLSLAVRSVSEPVAQRALDLVIRYKALGAEALAVQRDAVLGGRYPSLEPGLRELGELRVRIGQKLLAGPGDDSPEAHRLQIAKLESQRTLLESELARQIPEMNLAQQLGNMDRQTLARALPTGSALIEYVCFNEIDFGFVPEPGMGSAVGSSRYLAIVLHAGDPATAQLLDLGETGPIDRLMTSFLASVTQQGAFRREATDTPEDARKRFDTLDGMALRQAIFDPLLPALGSCRRLFLAPDGELNRLPFEVLPIVEGRLLVDEYVFSYLSTGRDALRFHAQPSVTPGEPLVIADPDFDLGEDGASLAKDGPWPGRRSRDLERSGLDFRQLPGTRAEGEYVAQSLGVRPWLGNRALESHLKTHRSPRILHLATHGFFLENPKRDQDKALDGFQSSDERWGLPISALENPLLRSGLALAGANTWLKGGTLPPEAEDGLLTAEDVSGLDLLATELVVLSACETGLGEIQVGEGVFGLRRAFVLAGAKTLIMSLWKVPDQQTQELMENFYRRVLAGQGRAEALREAQLTLKAKYPDPFYWGAFICQGDPAPLPALALGGNG